MANEVFANGREISCKAGDGKSICAFPDVCMTPPENPATPPGVPVPYPNTGIDSDATDGTRSVHISDKEIMLKNKSYYKSSTGDEAGCAAKKGVVTSTNRGKVYFIVWSMNVQAEGENVVRHLDLTTHNHASPMANGSVPTANQQSAAASPPPPPCNPHTWVEHSRETPDETKKKNSDNAKLLRSKPSKAPQAVGPEFENKAIDENTVKMNIQATSVLYKCVISDCQAQQEVDIVGQHRIAEAKSRTAKGVKNGKTQHTHYIQIQQQLFGSGTKPLAKVDATRSDTAEAQSIFDRRGFSIEALK